SDSRVCFGWALTRERRCPCPPPERFESSVRGTAFPATLHATRSLRRLVAGASLRAWGTRCRVRWPFGRNQGGGRRPGDIRPKGHRTRQEALSGAATSALACGRGTRRRRG